MKEPAITPLTRSVGAEISGVDLSQPLDQEVLSRIKSAWLDYGVLVFRDQRLEDEHQVGFAERFGTIQVPRTRPGGGKHPAVLIIGNVTVDGQKGLLSNGEMQFHSDQCYYENPSWASTLYAIEIPSAGGNTLFADCRAAYDDLPESLKRRLDGLKALNVYDYDSNATSKSSQSSEDAPRFVHPVSAPTRKRSARGSTSIA